jgi:hypothetical protein
MREVSWFMSDKTIGIVIDFEWDEEDPEYGSAILKNHAGPDGDPIFIKQGPSGLTSLKETKLALVEMLEQYDAGRLPGDQSDY